MKIKNLKILFICKIEAILSLWAKLKPDSKLANTIESPRRLNPPWPEFDGESRNVTPTLTNRDGEMVAWPEIHGGGG